MGLLMTPTRNDVVDISFPFDISQLTFTSPMPVKHYFNTLLQPFDKYIWMSCIAVITLIMCLIYFYNQTTYMKYNLLWDTLAIIFRQNISNATRVYPNNLILLAWLLSAIILYVCYSGSIFSLITVPIEYRIKTICQLLGSHNFDELQEVV